MLKFAANVSLLFTETELSLRFKAAKQHGFNAVEIQFPYSLSPEQLRDLLQEAELELVLFNVAADDLLQGGEGLACVPEKQQHFEQALAQTVDYASVLKPTAINILPGRCFNAHRLPEYLATFKENLLFATNTFAALGIRTVFEAINTHDMPGFIIANGKQMLDIIEQINHPDLFMQYDIYHAAMMGDIPDVFIKQHADKIGHIQFADCPGRGQPYTGKLDFIKLFTAIEHSAYTGWLGAEYKPQGTTAESLTWLKKFS